MCRRNRDERHESAAVCSVSHESTTLRGRCLAHAARAAATSSAHWRCVTSTDSRKSAPHSSIARKCGRHGSARRPSGF